MQACKVVLQAGPRNAEYQEETGVEKHTVHLSPPFLSSTQCFAEKFERNEGGMKNTIKKKKKRETQYAILKNWRFFFFFTARFERWKRSW